MTIPQFTLLGRLRSFACAGAGVYWTIKSQPNAWIHAFATCTVVVLGRAVGLSRADWCWIVQAIAAVWMAECLNTAVEAVADAVAPEHNVLIGRAKDAAAGGVLIAAVGAVAIAGMVFGPHVGPLVAAWQSRT